MVKCVLLFLILFVSQKTYAQSFFTRNGEVSFHSETPLENIDAKTRSATTVVDLETGELAFAILMKSFQFKKALMQEHFNENYVESSKYPKATYKGKIIDLNLVDLSKNGTYAVETEGEMTIHGVTKKVKVPGTVKVLDNTLHLTSKFIIKPEDYEIEIPSLVRDKIAKTVEVHVNSLCKPFNK